MKALIYDTETTGLPLWREPSEDPRQPHIVQLAALLVDLDTRVTVASLDLIVKPEGWEIPADVSKIHGITTEHARQVGVDECDVVGVFGQLWKAAAVRIGHNESFDARIVRCALMRFHGIGFGPHPDAWKDGEAECTMRMATPICNLGKFPKLVEAHKILLGRELTGAHSAMGDAVGCRDIYFAMKDRAAV